MRLIWELQHGYKRENRMNWNYLIESVENKPMVPMYKPLIESSKQPEQQEQKEKVEKPNNSNRVDKLV